MLAALIAVLGLVLPLGLAACDTELGAGRADDGVELSFFWWGGQERASITNKVLDLYTKKHPTVRFKKQWQANNGYYEKLASMTAGGTGPDVFQIDDNALTEHAVRGIALDLTGYIGPGRTIDQSRFTASLIGYGNINGAPYGVPIAENTPALFYDRTAIRELGMAEPQIGWTYEQFIRWAAEVTATSGGKLYGAADPSADYKALWLWLRAQGKELYDGTRLAFTVDDLQRWFDLWATARAQRATPPPEITVAANTNDTDKQLIVNKLGVTTFAWSNMLAEFQKNTEHELGITAFPGNPRGQWARASQYWSVYRGCKHPDIAADVINFFVNDPEAGRLLGTERGVPVNLDIRAQIATTLPASMQATLRYEDTMAGKFGPAPAPPPKGHNQIRTLLIQAAESVLLGKATTRQASTQLMIQAEQALTA